MNVTEAQVGVACVVGLVVGIAVLRLFPDVEFLASAVMVVTILGTGAALNLLAKGWARWTRKSGEPSSSPHSLDR